MSERAPYGLTACLVLVALLCLAGCTELSEWAASLGPQESAIPPVETHPEPEQEPLPEKPPDSTARSETQVITFQSVLENTEMTREERIHAFENLDPGALQKPVARANVSGPPTSAAERPRAERVPADSELAAARRRVRVVMYSTSWCGVCKRARSYFQENQIAFEEHDVDKDAIARAEYERLNPRRSVPTMKIGNEVVVGFSAAAVERALDAAARQRID